MHNLCGHLQTKGPILENFNLSRKSWFGVGGSAEFAFFPEDMDDLIFFLRAIPQETEVIILGAMSNVLIRSGGIKGIVIILGEGFKKVFIENNILEVGGGTSCSKIAIAAMDNDIGGLEFLNGLPGTIGGAIKMNAGCYGSEIVNILVEFEVVLPDGKIKWFKTSDLDFKYRASGLKNGLFITRAWLKGISDVKYSIVKKVRNIMAQRNETQPINVKCCGSTFKNPSGHKAWQLIKESECSEMQVGDAMLSKKHCNFIVNKGNATPEDIENLGEEIIKKVLVKTGIKLEWEIIILGKAA